MKILIVGISTRALAQSAAAAGAEVVSLDFFGDRDQPASARVLALGRDLHRPLTLLALAEEAEKLVPTVEAVIVESGLENEPALHAIGRPEQRWYNPGRAVQAVRDLRALGPVLAGTGLGLPEIIQPGEALPVDGRWLVKDGRHSGGVGVREWDRIHPPAAAEILERFVPGRLASACFVADGREAILLGMTAQYAGVAGLGAPPFAWCGNTAPFGETALQDLVRDALRQLVRACGLIGLNGIDLVVGARGPVLLEVNPRPPASFELFERLLGVNAFRLHGEACRGQLPSALPRLEPGQAWGKGILYAPRNLDVRDMQAWAKPDLADIPHGQETIPAGAPLCTLLASGPDGTACWRRVMRKARDLQKLL